MSDVEAGTVLVAYLHTNQVSHSFLDSMHRLIGYDLGQQARVVRGGGPVMFRCGPGNLAEGRNNIAEYFLGQTKSEWLWMVDSDMGFAPDIVERLVQAADPAERPVVGGLCFGVKEVQPDGMGGFLIRPFPTLYDWARDGEGTFGFRIRRKYRPNTLTQVAGTGAACVLIHRGVFEKIQADLGGPVWFDQSKQTDGKPVSEDLSFCFRVNAAGFPVYVHTGIQTTHHKSMWVGEDIYLLFEQAWTRDDDAEAEAPSVAGS